MEVQLHVDVRMRQKAGTQTTKIKSAKSFVMVHPRKCIPSKYTRYTVYSPYKRVVISLCHATSYYMCKTPTSQVAYSHNQNQNCVVNYIHCASTLGRIGPGG